MANFIKTTAGFLINIGDNGEFPRESELVFGLAHKDGEIARYPDKDGKLTKYLITNDEYDLYSYLTEEQYAQIKFHNGWCLVELLVPPSVEELKKAIKQLAKEK